MGVFSVDFRVTTTLFDGAKIAAGASVLIYDKNSSHPRTTTLFSSYTTGVSIWMRVERDFESRLGESSEAPNAKSFEERH